MDIPSFTIKKNDETPRAVDRGPRSYVFVYKFDMLVGPNLEIDPTT